MKLMLHQLLLGCRGRQMPCQLVCHSLHTPAACRSGWLPGSAVKGGRTAAVQEDDAGDTSRLAQDCQSFSIPAQAEALGITASCHAMPREQPDALRGKGFQTCIVLLSAAAMQVVCCCFETAGPWRQQWNESMSAAHPSLAAVDAHSTWHPCAPSCPSLPAADLTPPKQQDRA